MAIKIHCWTWGGRGGWDQLIWLVRSLLRNLMAMRANTDLEKLHILLGGVSTFHSMFDSLVTMLSLLSAEVE